MKGSPLLLSKPILYTLFVLGFLITVFGALCKILHLPGAYNMLTTGSVLSVIACIVVFIDIIKNNLDNKIFWLLSILIFSNLASVIYLIRREKVINV